MSLDSGADKFRDDWVPVPLIVNDYNADAKTYVIEFYAPKQLLLNEQFEAMVHDELLRNADRRGLIVEGQINVTTTDDNPPPPVTEEPENPAYKMSEAEKEMRARLRGNLQQTASEALDVAKQTVEGRELPTGETFRIDPDAFMEGFFGQSLERPVPERMRVRAEAFISIDLGGTTEAEVIEHDVLPPDIDIPDDLSGLDDA